MSQRLPPHEIVGVGAPIIDYILNVSEEYLEQVPGAKGGMVVVDHSTLTEIVGNSKVKPSQFLGGSSANTIRGLTHLGRSCLFIGKVGEDISGRQFQEGFAALKIGTLLSTSKTPTSQVACLITPDKERTMRSFLGASKELKPDDINPQAFEGAKLVHLEGYTILNLPIAKRAMQLAKEANAKVSFDLGSFEVAETYRDVLIPLLSKYVDVLFANHEEVRSLTQLDPEKGCAFLKSLCEVSVVLMGEKGCWVGSGSRQVYCPAFAVRTLDTTGAGDFFASGFLHGYLKGLPIEECARYGSLTGAAVVGTHGVEIPSQGWDTILQKMNEGPAKS